MKGGKPAENDEEYVFRYDNAEVIIDDDSLPTIVVGPRNNDSIKKLQNGDFSNALCYVEVSSKSGDMLTCYALGKDVIGAAKQMMVDPYSLMYKTYTGGAEGDVDSSKKQDMNCSEGLNCDASGISGAQDLLQKFVDDAASKYHTNLTLEWKPYSWKWSPEKTSIQYVIQEHTENSDGDYTMSEITAHPSEVQEFANSVKTFIRETVIPYLVDNAPEVDRIHGLFNDGSSYLQLGDFDTDSPDVDKNDYEEELDSSKNQSMNCSEGESGTIYTDSGNEVAITDIKVVQNPETNALALFVPENGDDEIPEGFTVIGDVIATASGAPAIEENAETGDDSLNSSKKPPMNRAQRRAAQRGARRPKKR
jgi:hypothetical protein